MRLKRAWGYRTLSRVALLEPCMICRASASVCVPVCASVCASASATVPVRLRLSLTVAADGHGYRARQVLQVKPATGNQVQCISS